MENSQEQPVQVFTEMDTWPAFTRWAVLTVFGYFLGAWAGSELGQLFMGIWNPGADLVKHLMAGAGMGAAQAWMLKDHMRGALGWFGVTTIAMALLGLLQQPIALHLPHLGLIETIVDSLQGAFLGAMQWLVLRRKIQPHLWWIGLMAFAYLVMNLVVRIAMLILPMDGVIWLTQALCIAGMSGYGIVLVLMQLPDEPDGTKAKRRFRSLRSRESAAAQAHRPVPKLDVDPKPQEEGELPRQLLIGKRGLKLKRTYDKQVFAYAYKFRLPRRPRAARLRVVYSGMSRSTQQQYRQHAQLNEKLLFELHPRAQDLEQAAEYTGDIPVDLFGRDNELYFVSRAVSSEGQQDNPFRLHAALIELEW